ncbi:unnamed protein product [Musa acuminata var. zebrina]
MGVSYRYASSVLLSPEDSNGVLGLGDTEGQDFHGEAARRDLWRFPDTRSGIYAGISADFTLQSEDCVALMVERESQHLPQGDYVKRLLRGQLDLAIRSDAIDWIQKVHAHHRFGPLSAYLSVNYLDRFLSSYKHSQGKAWMTQLLSVACLSLAAKADETEVLSSLDLQIGEARYVFEARTVQRMELLVLSTLKWRMQVVTPFSFIDYFLYKFSDGIVPDSSLVSRSVGLILGTVREIDFLEFRPSEIAAAVALTALKKTQVLEVGKAVTCCNHVDMERVLRCNEVIQEMTLMKNRRYKKGGSSVSTAPKSPIGVLDAACVSYESDDITVGSHANCHPSSPAAKRRKLNRSSSS